MHAASPSSGRQAAALCGLLACMVLGPACAQQRETRLSPVATRDTVLRPVAAAGGLGGQARDTVFRQAEIPAGKLEQTQRLLQQLQARETLAREIVVELPADVLFDFDKSTLRADAYPVLTRAASLLEGYPQAAVRIEGHTDSKGSDAYNDALSLRRAEAVAAYLRQAGAGRPWVVAGHGERRPVAANTRPDGSDDPEGRQRNRRVEIVIGAAAPAAVQTPGDAAPSQSRGTSLQSAVSTR